MFAAAESDASAILTLLSANSGRIAPSNTPTSSSYATENNNH